LTLRAAVLDASWISEMARLRLAARDSIFDATLRGGPGRLSRGERIFPDDKVPDLNVPL
jgi:hypothetical protein